MYGQRANPYAALAGVGRHLEQAPSDSSALSAVAAAVADTLRLPYVAITLAEESSPAVTVGVLEGQSVELALQHAGTEVGRLTVGLRRGERRLSARDANA